MRPTQQHRIILGIDPGLAHTGWGVISQRGSKLSCVAYGCIETPASQSLPDRLGKIYSQIAAVVARYNPSCVSIETVWFGSNTTTAFATGQARGAALAACAGLVESFAEYTPKQIKLAIVGTGAADKEQVEYMVQHLLQLEAKPQPDHAADALAAAICYANYDISFLERIASI
ncbi:MAG TPA: crossover junction endodeoxyribonuclease RuvC [Eggerthellaceae bacterium]|nr:crossover junction endodeoxyribonuclease RuvC [Eggerthellaceae bacterium]